MLIGILSEKQDDSDFLFSSLDLYFLGDLQLAFVLSKEAKKEARLSKCTSEAVIHTARPTAGEQKLGLLSARQLGLAGAGCSADRADTEN